MNGSLKHAPPLHFSIIIPAHNEEQYIEETLRHIAALDYPRWRYEVVVIENGSRDNTYKVAKSLEKEGVRIFTIAGKGVSVAKNFGIAQIRAESDWVIFLDADTILDEGFLQDLNDFLSMPEQKNCTVGTTELRPSVVSLVANFWFAFYNLGHRFTKTSMAIQIFERSQLNDIQFPENLRMGEDLQMILLARKRGKFFYFATKDVHTSIRRFEQEGWIKVFLHWNFVALLPINIQKFFDYKVVR